MRVCGQVKTTLCFCWCNLALLHLQITGVDMVLAELRAAAKVAQDGWIISHTPQGYIISKGLTPDMRLEAERAGKKHVRYFQTLDSAARVMAEDIGVAQYTVRGRTPGQQEIF
jgi:hypothetical protein